MKPAANILKEKSFFYFLACLFPVYAYMGASINTILPFALYGFIFVFVKLYLSPDKGHWVFPPLTALAVIITVLSGLGAFPEIQSKIYNMFPAIPPPALIYVISVMFGILIIFFGWGLHGGETLIAKGAIFAALFWLFASSSIEIKFYGLGNLEKFSFCSFILFMVFMLIEKKDENVRPSTDENSSGIIGAISRMIFGKADYVVKFGKLTWDDRDFPRGWSITGETGTGKTEAAFKSLFIQLCKNRPEWGGVLLDQKGNLTEEIEEILEALKISDKKICLRVRPSGAVEDWKPEHRLNLLSMPGIDDMTYAKIIVDVATSAQGGKGEEKGFFSTQALTQIASGITLLRIYAQIIKEPVYRHVGLSKLYIILSNQIEVSNLLSLCCSKLSTVFNNLVSSPALIAAVDRQSESYRDCQLKINSNLTNLSEFRKKGRSVVLYGQETTTIRTGAQTLVFHPASIAYYMQIIKDNCIEKLVSQETGIDSSELKMLGEFGEIATHFNEKFLAQPPDQLGGVTSTIFNYLMFFADKDIAEVFSCQENTFDFGESLDNGKIIMVSMPKAKAVHRIFINTYLKILFYNHGLNRFDRLKKDRIKKNLIVLFADEAQGIVSKMDGGAYEDHMVVDQTRQANATVVFATQDLISYETKIGKDKSENIQLNLANKIVFKAASPSTASFYSKMFGKGEVMKRTGFSHSKGGKSDNYQIVEEPLFKDFEICNLKKFEAIVKHCEHPAVRMALPPVDNYGNPATWARESLKQIKQ